MTSTKTSKPCTHELFTNNFDATKNVNIEELHCKYFDGRFYRFSLSMWKKTNTALPTIYGKAICHLLKKTIHITYLPSKYLQCVLQNSEPTLNLKNILTIDLFQVQENKHIFMFFSAWKKLHDMAATFWPLYQLSMRIRDSRLHKNKGTAWFLG